MLLLETVITRPFTVITEPGPVISRGMGGDRRPGRGPAV